ncbi:MAG: hypothetical protein WCJ81_02170 [bacterium]
MKTSGNITALSRPCKGGIKAPVVTPSNVSKPTILYPDCSNASIRRGSAATVCALFPHPS